MNKKGFTLVELLAVVVILAVIMLIGSVSLGSVRRKIDKNMFEKKLDLVISSAKTWGQDNKSDLEVTKTIQNLLDSNYLRSDEKNEAGLYTVTNNYTGLEINNLKIKIYLSKNRVYACIVNDSANKSIITGGSASNWDEYNLDNYMC